MLLQLRALREIACDEPIIPQPGMPAGSCRCELATLRSSRHRWRVPVFSIYRFVVRTLVRLFTIAGRGIRRGRQSGICADVLLRFRGSRLHAVPEAARPARRLLVVVDPIAGLAPPSLA